MLKVILKKDFHDLKKGDISRVFYKDTDSIYFDLGKINYIMLFDLIKNNPDTFETIGKNKYIKIINHKFCKNFIFLVLNEDDTNYSVFDTHSKKHIHISKNDCVEVNKEDYIQFLDKKSSDLMNEYIYAKYELI